MDELERRARRAAESILENESLTEGLSDAVAQVLLDWGLACAERIAHSTAGLDDAEAEEAMAQGLRATRRLTRWVRMWVTHRAEMDAVARAESFDKIVGQAAIIYQRYTPPDDDQRAAFLRRAPDLVDYPIKMITDLRRLFEGPDDEATTDSGGTDDQEILD